MTDLLIEAYEGTCIYSLYCWELGRIDNYLSKKYKAAASSQLA